MPIDVQVPAVSSPVFDLGPVDDDSVLQPGIRSLVRERFHRLVIQASLKRLREIERARTGVRSTEHPQPVDAQREWMLLVLDRYALRIVSAAMRLSDLLNEGVALVERLELPREKFPRMHAIYILRPVVESFTYLSKPSRNEYAAIHVYFTRDASSLAAQLPGLGRPLAPEAGASSLQYVFPDSIRDRVVASVDLDLDFLALDERYFSLDRPFGALHRLYCPDQGSMVNEMQTQVEQLVSLCCTIGARPLIRFAVDAPLSKWMAHQLERALATHARARALPHSADLNKQVSLRTQRSQARRMLPGGGAAEASRTPVPWTLLIADRSYDPLAPVIHEFTYQAMVMDILADEIDRSHAGGARLRHPFFDSSGREQSREVVIDDVENDALFRSIRYLHMADAIPALTSAFQRFLDTNPAARLQMTKARKDDADGNANSGGTDGLDKTSASSPGTQQINLKQLGAAIRALPQYREQLSAFSLHTYLAGQCMRAFHERHLEEVASLEQDLACGRDLEGHRVRREALEQALLRLFPDIQRTERPSSTRDKADASKAPQAIALPDSERVRLVLIAMLAKYTGQCESAALFDERMMTQRARVSSGSVEHLLNGAKTLVSFRAPVNEYAPKNWWKRRQWRRRERKLHRMRMQQADVPYTLSRYVPAFRSVMQDFADGRLRASEWPLVSDHQVNASDGRTSAGANASSTESDTGTESDEHTTPKQPSSFVAGSNRRPGKSATQRIQRTKSMSTGSSAGATVDAHRSPGATFSTPAGARRRGSQRALSTTDAASVQRAQSSPLKVETAGGGASGSPAAAAAAAAAGAADDYVERTPRLVVFVAGGISYSEARSAAQVMSRTGQDIILGGSGMLVPTTYMQGLQALDDRDAACRLERLPVDPELEAALADARSSTETSDAGAPAASERTGLRRSGRQARVQRRGQWNNRGGGRSASWFRSICGVCCFGGAENNDEEPSRPA
jgi:syntaxin-binding protein 1